MAEPFGNDDSQKREEISPLFLKGKKMKLFHLSDLHIGKVINGYDMYEDQEYVFNQILEYMKQEQPDALIIAGDIYDKGGTVGKKRFECLMHF